MELMDEVIELSLRVQGLRDQLREAESELRRRIGESRETPTTGGTASVSGSSNIGRVHAVVNAMEASKSAQLEQALKADPSRRFTPKELGEAVKSSPESVRTMLRRLAAAGKAAKHEDGTFGAADPMVLNG